MTRKMLTTLLFVFMLSACGSNIETIQPFSTSIPTLQATSTFTPEPTQTLTPTITHTPKPTTIPCPEAGAPLVVDKVNIYFSENELKPSTCGLYTRYIAGANEWAKSIGESLVANVYIYNSAEDAGQADFDLGIKTKCNNYTSNSLPEIIQGWKRGGAVAYPPYKYQGASYPPSVILNSAWQESTQQIAQSTVHELVHTIQYPYYQSRNPCSGSVPSWWSEGQAMLYGLGVIEAWGIPHFELDLSECSSIQLSSLPQLTNNCVYGMGREALVLLTHLYGDKSFDVWKEFSKSGSTFDTAFEAVYGIRVREYSDIFEKYKQCMISLGFGVKADQRCLAEFDITPTP